tara:strand:+ start:816 stop:1226 length:411 start_codon:yes stop_codon:yes gene_type:complete
MHKKNKICLVAFLLMTGFLTGCESDIANRVGVSSSGFIIGIKALSGNAGLPADGTSQATIRVELFNTSGQLVDGQNVFLTTTLGTLTDTTLTTANGSALTRLTSGTVTGTAFIVASIENVSATAAVQIVNITGTVT